MGKKIICSYCGKEGDSVCASCWRCEKCCDCDEKTKRRINGVIGGD